MALFAVLLVLGGVLLGLAVGAVSAYVIDVGLTHVQPGP